MRRIATTLGLLGLLLSGCGEAGILDGVGDRTRNAVRGDTTTTTTVVAVVAGATFEELVSSADILWFNDDIDPQHTGPSDAVIAAVWERQLSSRFVQASRREIAAALPGLVFPELIAHQTTWITSQLVYNTTSGTLDADTSAAFGLWTAEPYQSDTARLGVLRVGRAPLEALASRSEIVPIAVPEGVSLGWTESGHKYELFCRTEVSEELCIEIASSSVPLIDLVP
ncbi:MAG: hypothetical protein ACR2N7_06995 [Acidimicrobiia bacterium]